MRKPFYFLLPVAVILVAWDTFENIFSVILLCKVRKHLLSSLNSQEQEEAKDQVVCSFFFLKWLLILDISISEGLASASCPIMVLPQGK